MDAFTAQYRAVVATAQLAAGLPDTAFDLRVVSQHVEGRRSWVVTVRWDDGPAVPEVQRLLDGPPPGIHLLRHVSMPELDRDRDT